MKTDDKRRCKVMASDVRTSLRQHTNVGVSARNYGLRATDDVVRELGRMLPGVKVSGGGLIGYIHFERKEAGDVNE